jgi:hypothetical protein
MWADVVAGFALSSGFHDGARAGEVAIAHASADRSSSARALTPTIPLSRGCRIKQIAWDSLTPVGSK